MIYCSRWVSIWAKTGFFFWRYFYCRWPKDQKMGSVFMPIEGLFLLPASIEAQIIVKGIRRNETVAIEIVRKKSLRHWMWLRRSCGIKLREAECFCNDALVNFYFKWTSLRPATIETVRKKQLRHGCDWGDLVGLNFVKKNVLQRRVGKLLNKPPYGRRIQTNRRYMFRKTSAMKS